jgi:hypothetical protein
MKLLLLLFLKEACHVERGLVFMVETWPMFSFKHQTPVLDCNPGFECSKECIRPHICSMKEDTTCMILGGRGLSLRLRRDVSDLYGATCNFFLSTGSQETDFRSHLDETVTNSSLYLTICIFTYCNCEVW